MKKAFTLAEIMIVLSVIAILTAILLPAARNAMPEKKIIKFKKAHETLYKVVGEMVNSDKYYLNGDLSTKINGDDVDGSKESDYTYFCETFADLVGAKKVNCKKFGSDTSHVMFGNLKNVPDVWCKTVTNGCSVLEQKSYIKTIDNVYFFEVNSFMTFGKKNENGDKSFSHKLFSTDYKAYCIDIDDLCKGEAPFGYGIRADGKILTGLKADEWLNKSIQEK